MASAVSAVSATSVAAVSVRSAVSVTSVTSVTSVFEDFVSVATGHQPSAKQMRFAADGLPEVVEIAAGTAAEERVETAVLPWLHRRMVSAPEATPRRLVYVVPMHGPVEEVFARFGEWLARLELAEDVGLHLVAGAAPGSGWQRRPEESAILVGTQDLLLSKALMRGFGDSAQNAPVSFGLLNNDVQWVFEDARRLGPGSATSVELQRLRDLLGTAAPARSTWMSDAPHLLETDGAAVPTLDRDALRTLFDNTVEPSGVVGVGVGVGVARLVCDEADWTVQIARRNWESAPSEEEPRLRGDELRRVPLADVRQMLGAGIWIWIRDRLDGAWRHAVAEDLKPGVTLVLHDPEAGPAQDAAPWAFACTAWVSLDQHLMETEEEARDLLDALPGLPADQQEAVRLAARYHDLGKCHDVFQEMLRGGGGDPPDHLLAKSKAPFSTGQRSRASFRHELVSALILMEGGHPWLTTYLVAAHHGHVRVSVRPGRDEAPFILGVLDGDQTPPIELSTGERFPAQRLQTTDVEPGGAWTERVLSLVDREDLGPFRLAYLETLVRVSDWRSSARHDGPVEALAPALPAAPAALSPEAASPVGSGAPPLIPVAIETFEAAWATVDPRSVYSGALAARSAREAG